jgi:ketosteroid isomerase-like protein
MPSGDREVVRTLLNHWEQGEFAPKLNHLHPDVVFVNRVSGRSFEGLGGARRLINEWDDAFEDWSIVVDDLIDCPDGELMAVGRVLMRGKKTGGELDRPVAVIFTLADGLIVRIDAFANRVDEAYAAAGLERA